MFSLLSNAGALGGGGRVEQGDEGFSPRIIRFADDF